MRVEADITCLVTQEHDNRSADITDEATIRELFAALSLSFGTTSIDIAKYYPWASGNFRMDSVLPYLIVDNSAHWMVPYGSAKVQDFFSTFAITDERIVVQYWYPAAGGPGWIDIVTHWNETYQALQILYYSHEQVIQTALKMGQVINILRGGVTWINSQRKKGRPPKGLEEVRPPAVFDLIARRAAWNITELMELTGLDKPTIRGLLVDCAKYRYDPRRQMHVQTDATEEALQAIKSVSVIPDQKYFDRSQKRGK